MKRKLEFHDEVGVAGKVGVLGVVEGAVIEMEMGAG